MGKVIAVAEQKGGSGKTMLAAQLAVALSEGAKVAALDIDPQGSLTIWGKLRKAAPKAAAAITCATTAGWRPRHPGGERVARSGRGAARAHLIIIEYNII